MPPLVVIVIASCAAGIITLLLGELIEGAEKK